MTFFNASFSTIILRFYLIMAIVIGAFFSGMPYLAALALPIVISAMAGVTFNTKKTSHI